MAAPRERSYAHFNFLIDFGEGASDGPHAAFQELSGLAIDAAGSEPRKATPAHDNIIKISGINKSVDIIMTRGVVDSSALNSWLDDIKKGGKKKATRTVFIRLRSEDRTSVAQSWKLVDARIIKHTSGPLNAKGTDVAIEELVISGARLELA
jgi:phage tail-like protein